MMFGLDCGRHFVCEQCIFGFVAILVKRTPVESGEEMQVPHFCIHCRKETRGVVGVSFKGVTEMPKPRPVGYFGIKAVFSPEFWSNMAPFFKIHIEWILLAFGEATRMIAMGNEVLREAQRTLNAEGIDGVPNDTYSLVSKSEKWSQVVRDQQGIVAFLVPKKPYIIWLIEWDRPYPKKFLEHDAPFYEAHLGRKCYEVLKRRADYSVDIASAMN